MPSLKSDEILFNITGLFDILYICNSELMYSSFFFDIDSIFSAISFDFSILKGVSKPIIKKDSIRFDEYPKKGYFLIFFISLFPYLNGNDSYNDDINYYLIYLLFYLL